MQYPQQVAFLNESNENDRCFLRADLEHRVELVSGNGGLRRGVASLLLYDFDFSEEVALQALRDQRSDTLARSGFQLRDHVAGSEERANKRRIEVCGICYEDASMEYSMACGHSFCLDCWQSYLRETLAPCSRPGNV